MISRKGRRHGRGLATMSSEVAPARYAPPGEHACDVRNWPLDLGTARLEVAQWNYRGRVVHFSIATWIGDDQTTRVDTSHGELHRHRFYRDRPEQRTRIEVIPVSDGWNFVNERYGEYLDKELENMGSEIERWSR